MPNCKDFEKKIMPLPLEVHGNISISNLVKNIGQVAQRNCQTVIEGSNNTDNSNMFISSALDFNFLTNTRPWASKVQNLLGSQP